GELEYVIKHALTRDVAYDTILKAKRALLHAAFAGWLERNRANEDEHAAMLAHHYAEAVRPEDLDLAWSGREDEAEQLRIKAVAWSARAAELAVGRYEVDEGLALLARAVELEVDPAKQARLWHAIGRAHAAWAEDAASARALEAVAERLGDADLRSLALEAMDNVAWEARDPAWVQRLADGQFELLSRLSDPDDRTRALLHIAFVYVRL